MKPDNLPDLSLFHDATDVQIRFNDVDVLGHVNNTIYFAFYDTAKAHYVSAVRGRIIEWSKVEMVIANVDCAFIAPCYYGENLEVLTRCKEIFSKSAVLVQVLREKNTGEIKSICETVMVFINPETMTSAVILDDWRKQFADFEGREFPAPSKS